LWLFFNKLKYIFTHFPIGKKMYNSLRYHLNNMKLLYKLDTERYLNIIYTLMAIGIMSYAMLFIKFIYNEKTKTISTPIIIFIYIIIYLLLGLALSSMYDTLRYKNCKLKILLLRDLIDGIIILYILDYFDTF
jgi:O-antigen/teichoic acid export membrane protein